MGRTFKKIKLVEIGGNPFEMGFQYGSACPEIAQVFGIALEASGLEKVSAITLTEEYIPFIEEYSPDIMDELKGIAEGAGLDVRQIVFLNIWYELGLQCFAGCTSYAASGEATRDGELIIGQNWDMAPVMEEMVVLLRMKPTGGPAILAITTPGLLGLISINSAGIALDGNFLCHKNFMGLPAGTPHMVWVRKAQAGENIGKAIGAIATAKRSGCAVNTLLGSRQGDIVDIEVTPDDLGILYPRHGYLVHSNHFYTERFKKYDMIGSLYPDSIVRSHRLSTLMEKHLGSLSVDVMKELLQDHNNYPQSICRHTDVAMPPEPQWKTVASIISYPKEEKMYIAYGNPCEREYVEYRL